MPIRVQLQPELFAVQTFFNALADADVDRVLASLRARVGWSVDVCHCEFPGDLDPNEPPFEGVRFSIYEESVVLDERELEEVIRLVFGDRATRHPSGGPDEP